MEVSKVDTDSVLVLSYNGSFAIFWRESILDVNPGNLENMLQVKPDIAQQVS